MKKSLYDALLLLMLPLSLWACNGTTAPATEAMALPTDSAAEDPAEVTSDSTRNGTWISEFIRRIFPDRDFKSPARQPHEPGILIDIPREQDLARRPAQGDDVLQTFRCGGWRGACRGLGGQSLRPLRGIGM